MSRPRLRGLSQFVRTLAKKTVDDEIPVESSALAFGTVLSLVPLLAAFLWVGRLAFAEYRDQVLRALQEFLPYSEETLLKQITEFLDHAEAIQGVGILGFAIVAIMTFSSIESTINRIWNVTAARSIRVRLTSFLLLLLFGPLLIGAAYSLLAYLRTQPTFDRVFDESWLLQWTPFLVTAFGLTMLYWLVPNTSVRKRAALVGGLSAALLFEGLRAGFHLYLSLVPGLNLVYGGFALALIFMISIQVAWFIVLLGCEVAYGVQHRGWMSESTTTRGIDPGWLAVAALVNLSKRATSGKRAAKKPVRHEALADDLEIPADDLRDLIAPLLEAGWVESADFRSSSYRLKADLETVDVADVLRHYWLSDEALAEAVPKGLETAILDLRNEARKNVPASLGPVARLLIPSSQGREAQLELPKVEEPVVEPTVEPVVETVAETVAEPVVETTAETAPEPAVAEAPVEELLPALPPELEVTRILVDPKARNWETGEMMSLAAIAGLPAEPSKEEADDKTKNFETGEIQPLPTVKGPLDLDETIPAFRGDETLPINLRVRRRPPAS
jgi:membrane protein